MVLFFVQRRTPLSNFAQLTSSQPPVAIIGAGLAGSECAWILAEQYSQRVILIEMKPKTMTPAQCMPGAFAELVCSNSLKSTSLLNPSGILKEEMISLGSLVVPSAKLAKVPAGEALAVDREAFSGAITKALSNHPLIQVECSVVDDPEAIRQQWRCQHVVAATGPLTHGGLAESLVRKAGGSASETLYFYDAIAPIIDGDSIDRSIAFFSNRENREERRASARALTGTQVQSGSDNPKPPEQDSGEGDYLNLPLSKEQYLQFVERLRTGPKLPHHAFEEPRYFNGCQPIEVLAESGPLTLAHGPMKGRGLTDPKTGRWPFAAVQLRREKWGDDAFNMVGFQTRLTWPAQKEIFATLPALASASFHRMGSMHRNTYFCSPALLGPYFSFQSDPFLYLCGQIMGVEGYLESAAMGALLGHVIGHRIKGQELQLPPTTTAIGALARHVKDGDPANYSPMNLNWGIFDPINAEDVARVLAMPKTLPLNRIDKGTRRQAMSQRARSDFGSWLHRIATP
jgi:methylenetetrahydrofolate--tRNA-(uracil-5-)-methyltransferase